MNYAYIAPDKGETVMNACKPLLATLSATMLLGSLVSIASAGRLEASNQTSRAQFRAVEIVLPFGTTTCQLTLEGSLHSRTISKVQGRLIGYLTRAALGPCSSGSATVLTETLPWHVEYINFQGTLPNITQLTTFVINFAIRAREPSGIICLIRSEAGGPLVDSLTRETAGGVLTTAQLSGSVATGGECFVGGTTVRSDRGPLTVLGATTRITVRLI